MTDAGGKTILVIEDDTTLNRLLCEQLKRMGYRAVGVRSLAEAEKSLRDGEPSLVLLDIRLPDSEGVEAITRFREICPVIILTAYGSVEQAVKAVQAGASDYLIKPVSPSRIEIAISRALETATLRRKLELLETKSVGRPLMVGRSEAFRKVTQLVGLVAAADTTVLVQGESGVGKELVAESIHKHSKRASQQLITIDCASLHENLLESELFGHERGSFTGADRKKEGLIEVAEGGTVFLDEIGEISATIQAKLLRVLETSRFRRLGGTHDISADVRFVTATNRDLGEWVKEGKFRGDLYYRLSPVVITVPPLRERRDDILVIAQHFLESRNFMRNVEKSLHPSTQQALLNYDWPGNIRELRNAVERGILMSEGGKIIMPQHVALPQKGGTGASFMLSFDHEPTLDEVKAAYFSRMMHNHGNSRAAAARAMGISERSVYRVLSDARAADTEEMTQ